MGFNNILQLFWQMLRVGKAKPETWPKPAPKTRGKNIWYYYFRFFTMHLNLRNLVTSQETSGAWRGICTVKVLYSLLPLKALSSFQMRTLWHSLCQWIVMEKATALTAYLCPASRIPSAKLLRQPSWNWTNRPQLIIYQVKGRGEGMKNFWSEKMEYFPFFLWEKREQQFWGPKIGHRTVLNIVRLWFLNSLTRASVSLKWLS